jgi:hypothetical protein
MNPIPPLKSLKSLVPRGGVEPPTHGFSEVALRANINDLAGGGWQKPGAVSHSMGSETMGTQADKRTGISASPHEKLTATTPPAAAAARQPLPVVFYSGGA